MGDRVHYPVQHCRGAQHPLTVAEPGSRVRDEVNPHWWQTGVGGPARTGEAILCLDGPAKDE